MTYGEGPGPLAIAHRGGAALAQENSLVAFGLASALGLRYLETDVRVTCDGRLVCFHDDTLERVTSATGLVRSKSLRELRALRINGIEPIPTLDEALDAFPEQCFTVDLKDQAAIEPLVKSLQRKGVAERVCIAGAWDGWLGQVRSEVPEVTTALGWRSLTALLSCARTGVRPPKALATAPFAHVPVKLGRVPIFVERLVAMSHDIGVRVVTWTVDEPVREGGCANTLPSSPAACDPICAAGRWAWVSRAPIREDGDKGRSRIETRCGFVLTLTLFKSAAEMGAAWRCFP